MTSERTNKHRVCVPQAQKAYQGDPETPSTIILLDATKDNQKIKS